MNPGILVPLDGSAIAEQALPYARALAAPGADLVLLQVVPEPEPIAGLWGQPYVSREAVQAMSERLARDDLERAAAMARRAGLGMRFEVALGDPAEQILRVAEQQQVGLIAMTTHGRGAVGRWVFGSVADRVARTSPVPVLIVRPSEEEPATPDVRRLVVPLDGSALAEEALPAAQTLAERLGIPVHLVRAFDVTGLVPPSLIATVAFDASLHAEAVARLRADAEALLARVGERLEGAGVATSREVLDGSPFFAIAAAARPGDVIVIASHGRGGVRRWLLGSVAEKLVREGPVPVILVPTAARRGVVESGSDGAARSDSPAPE